MAYTQNIVMVVNRTTKPLDVMDDGRPFVIPPGYVVVPDIDPDTNEQRVERQKVNGKSVEVPLFKVVGAAKPVNGVQEPSHDGAPYQHPMLAGAAIRARRQHILRGSQDPTNPQFAETLVAIVGVEGREDDPFDHQEQSNALESFDRSLLGADRQAITVARNPHHVSSDRRRSLVDSKLTNVAGIRMDY